MIIARIVLVDAVANQIRKKESIDAFIMMQRLQLERVEPESRCNQDDD